MTRSLLFALIGLVAAIAAMVLFFVQTSEDAGDSIQTVQAPLPPPVTVAPEIVEPSFDVVRIGERGDAVIAGRAKPRADVRILDGGQVIGQVTADERGEWVFVPTDSLAPGTKQLTIEATNPDGTVARSSEPVILVVPQRPGDPAIAVKPQAKGGAKLLQAPAPAQGAGDLTIDIVDRDPSGGLFVGGRARAGDTVMLYLDNRLVGRGRADDDGNWSVSGNAPKGGSHTLRADRVDGKGKVLRRVEVPYDAGTDVVAPGSVVVRPGNSLWRIARQAYGSGPAFTVIFEANKDRIRDPDRIYPGQVFSVPAR